MDDSMSKKELVSRLMADALSAPVDVDGNAVNSLFETRDKQVRGVKVDPEYCTVHSECEADLKSMREAFCVPPQDSTEIVVGRLDGEPLSEFARHTPRSTTDQPSPADVDCEALNNPFVSDAPIKPLSADEILAADPETAQDIIDWQDATYLLLGAMMLSQGKLAARISVAQLEKFRQKYQLQFTKGADGSLNYKVRQKPKNSGAKNV